MRKKSVKHALITRFDAIKATLRNNRKLLFIGLAFVGVGLLISLFGITDYAEEHPKESVLSLICSGDFSVFSFEIKLIVFITLPVFICFLLSVNYYLFLCCFPLIGLASFWFFRFVFACFCCEFWHGLISFLFVLLPVACLVFIGTILFIASLCEIIRFAPCKKIFYLTPYSTYIRTTKKLLQKYLLCIALPAFLYANIAVIVMYLCCHA